MFDDSMRGRRMTVRCRRPGVGDASEMGPVGTFDTVGELLSFDDRVVTIRAKSGTVTLPRADVQAARVVGASHRDVLTLAQIARLGWRANEVLDRDGWLLAADAGWTGRANSALLVRLGDTDVDDQLAMVTDFYTAGGLPTQIQLPMPARSELDSQLAHRGWIITPDVAVLTRPLSVPLPPLTDLASVSLSAELSPTWLNTYRYLDEPLPASAPALLTRHDQVRFASARSALSDGRLAGIARGTIEQDHLGITSVQVVPELRRHGIATALIAELFEWARHCGAHTAYLQVMSSNSVALATYARLGFTEHHRYHYRVRPTVSAVD